ncbi:MAG: SDR family oxidoreductase [Gammaproteobacteria bacterium]
MPLVHDNAAIVVNTTVAHRIGLPTSSVYAATKAALRSLVRSLSAELIERGVRVNAVAPGPIETPIYSRMGLPQEAVQRLAAGILSRVPMKRFGRPEEVAGAVLFLASPLVLATDGPGPGTRGDGLGCDLFPAPVPAEIVLNEGRH